MLSDSQLAQTNGTFPTAKNSIEVLNYLQDISKNSIIFVDIDDTIITPVSKTFRRAPHNKLIADIKKNKIRYKNFEEIVSNWRLQRKVMLTDSDWSHTILQLKQKHRVYALTKMDTGKFGNIESIEQWRYAELKSLGIEFSDDNIVPQVSRNRASFYKGLFMTGYNSKSQTIAHYLQYLKMDTVVIIDDKEENLKDIRKFCKKYSMHFIGILFNGLENFTDVPHPDVVHFQKQYLIQHARWLEDEEAQTMIKQNSTTLLGSTG